MSNGTVSGKLFDARKKWVIIRPASCAEAAELLAEAITKLRMTAITSRQTEPPAAETPPQIDSNTPAPEDNIIIINCDEGSRKTSFSWRAAESRVEIYGHALSSVMAAIVNFLDALGFQTPANGSHVPPAPNMDGLFALSRASAYQAEQ